MVDLENMEWTPFSSQDTGTTSPEVDSNTVALLGTADPLPFGPGEWQGTSGTMQGHSSVAMSPDRRKRVFGPSPMPIHSVGTPSDKYPAPRRLESLIEASRNLNVSMQKSDNEASKVLGDLRLVRKRPAESTWEQDVAKKRLAASEDRESIFQWPDSFSDTQ